MRCCLALAVLIVLVLAAPMGGSLPLGPASGIVVDNRPDSVLGMLLPLGRMETYHATSWLATNEVGLRGCGGDAITSWELRVTAHGLAPLERVHVSPYYGGAERTLTFEDPIIEIRSASPTTCMAGVWLDGRDLLAPIAWTVEPADPRES